MDQHTALPATDLLVAIRSLGESPNGEVGRTAAGGGDSGGRQPFRFEGASACGVVWCAVVSCHVMSCHVRLLVSQYASMCVVTCAPTLLCQLQPRAH